MEGIDEKPYYMVAIEAMDFQIGVLLESIPSDETENTVIISGKGVHCFWNDDNLIFASNLYMTISNILGMKTKELYDSNFFLIH